MPKTEETASTRTIIPTREARDLATSLGQSKKCTLVLEHYWQHDRHRAARGEEDFYARYAKINPLQWDNQDGLSASVTMFNESFKETVKWHIEGSLYNSTNYIKQNDGFEETFSRRDMLEHLRETVRELSLPLSEIRYRFVVNWPSWEPWTSYPLSNTEPLTVSAEVKPKFVFTAEINPAIKPEPWSIASASEDDQGNTTGEVPKEVPFRPWPSEIKLFCTVPSDPVKGGPPLNRCVAYLPEDWTKPLPGMGQTMGKRDNFFWRMTNHMDRLNYIRDETLTTAFGWTEYMHVKTEEFVNEEGLPMPIIRSYVSERAWTSEEPSQPCPAPEIHPGYSWKQLFESEAGLEREAHSDRWY